MGLALNDFVKIIRYIHVSVLWLVLFAYTGLDLNDFVKIINYINVRELWLVFYIATDWMQ